MAILSLVFEAIFWSALALTFYSYVCYPLLIWGFARVFGRRGEPVAFEETQLPTVSILIACYNEAEVIAKQLENTLKINYPADKLEIVIASDGSSDGTPEIVEGFAGRGVRLLNYLERRGKAAALNASFPQLTGEIVVLCDGNTFLEPGSVRHLIRWFGDRSVGVVCGRLVLTDPITGTNVDSLYWQYENVLKKYESRLGALLGANGGIYAIRRKIFVPIPDNTIIDDFVIPLLARLHHGCSLHYEQRAIAEEETPPSVRSEFRRRARIGTGGFQSIPLLWRLLAPTQGWVAYSFCSHKILRWLCPFFLVAALLSNMALVGQPIYASLLAVQAVFYAWSFAASWLPARNRLLRLLKVPTMFVSMNAALLVGFYRWMAGGQKGIWHRTERSAATVQTWEAVR